jgi:AcrR family transcriptional regulator
MPVRKQKARESALSEEALQTRRRILDAAEQVFSRKGFDGARVDEIASTAGVNKALIYYYFESKKAVLGELVNRVLQELVAEKEAAFDSLPAGTSLATGEVPKDLMQRGIEMTTRRMTFFGILCTEALKNGDDMPALFGVMDRYMASLFPSFSKLGLPAPSLEDIRLPAMFFGFAPIVFFELLKRKWAEYYKVDQTALQETFYELFGKVYAAGVVSLLKPKTGGANETATD